jgi:hypothetical protein
MNRASHELWSAWKAGRLCFQHCDKCGRAQHPPGPVCSCCHSTSLSHLDVSGEGELVAWSTVHRPPSPAFADQVPYTVAVVRLPEGALVEVRTLGTDDPDAWKVGQRVVLELGVINGRALPTARVAAISPSERGGSR